MNRPTLSLKLVPDGSVIFEGASAVAGVAEDAAITGSFTSAGDAAVRSVKGAVADAWGAFRSAAPAEAITEADGEAAATVSTVGESDGAATAGMSEGVAGLPAAIDPFANSVAGATGSRPPMAALGAGEASASVSLFSIFALVLLANAVAGIGLGSIAGLASVCAEAKTAASVEGPGELPVAGL